MSTLAEVTQSKKTKEAKEQALLQQKIAERDAKKLAEQEDAAAAAEQAQG